MSTAGPPLEATLVELISRDILGDPDLDLSPEEDLLGSDLLDSLGVMRLVELVEKRHGITISAADVTLENFSTVHDVAALIRQRQEAAGGSELD